MKASYVLGVLFSVALGALSMGCVAQAGTDVDTSQNAEGLTSEPAAPQQQQQAQKHTQVSANAFTQMQRNGATIQPEVELKELAGTDPGGNVQDDGDGKEPDPHPWHSTRDTTLATH